MNESPFISPVQFLSRICAVCTPNEFSLFLSGSGTRPGTGHGDRTQPTGGGRLLIYIKYE